MKWSFATIGVIMIGIIGVAIILLFQSLTTSNENDYYLLKEITEAAMIEAIDIPYYRETGDLKIVREKFVENFTRRYAESTVFVSNEYKIMFYDIMEKPPKVSVIIDTGLGQFTIGGYTDEYAIKNQLDGILEFVGENTFNSNSGDAIYTTNNTFQKTYYAMPASGGLSSYSFVHSLKVPGELVAFNIKNIKISSVVPVGVVNSQGELNKALLDRELSFNVTERTNYMQFIKDFDTSARLASSNIYNCGIDGIGTDIFTCDNTNKYWIYFNVVSGNTTKSKSIFKYIVTWSYDKYELSD